jgi:hypothetical protein
MPEFHSDSLVPPKYGVISPFAQLAWGAIILAVLGVAALFVTKFDFSRLRGADHFIGKARQAITAQNWPAAVAAIHHIQGRNRERPEFLRILADFLEATHTEPSLLDTTLVKLETKGLMLPVDYIWACRLQLAAGKIEIARKALERIPDSSRQTAEVMKLSIELLRQEGRPREAAEVENFLFEQFADDPETAVRKAVRDLEGAFPEIQQAALQRLWELARREDEAGIAAIRLLSRRSDLTLPDSVHLREIANNHPGISAGDRLAIISVLMRLDPMRRDLLLAAEVQRYEKADAATQTQLASWLAKEKEYDQIIALLSKEMLMTSPDLFPQVAQGLAEQHKWAELMNLIKKGNKLPVSNARAATWRALATKNLHPGNTKEIRLHVEEAIREGRIEKNGLALLGAARMAEGWGMADLALKAYEALAVPGAPQEADMLEKCWQTASTLKNSATLLKLAEKCARLRPANVQLAARLDYMRLLCGEQLETTLTSSLVGTSGHSAEQESDVSQLLQALKAYRLQDHAALTLALVKIGNGRTLTAGERAVYAGLQAITGQTAKAYALAESVRAELLLDEETVFFLLAL